MEFPRHITVELSLFSDALTRLKTHTEDTLRAPMLMMETATFGNGGKWQ